MPTADKRADWADSMSTKLALDGLISVSNGDDSKIDDIQINLKNTWVNFMYAH